MRRVLWRRFDLPLLALVLLLSGFGILMVSSAVSGNVLLADYPLRQAIFLTAGMVIVFVVSAIDYRLLTSITLPLYAFLLVALLIIAAIGTVSGGAQRWFTVGEFFIQPSEMLKLAVILTLAHFLARREEKMDSILTVISGLLILAPAVILIYLQPNLSTAVSLLPIGGMMLIVAGLRWHHAVLIALGAAAAAVPIWQYLLEDYMKDRFLMFLNPATAAASSTVDTYNVDQALISIGSGGWLGRGLFHGSQSQLHFLRVRHTDFIFSVIAEELGFVGALFLILLFALLLFRLVRIATLARDSYGRLIVTGVTTMILFQFMVNVGMNLNMLPVTGTPLPLISYGGSSLLTVLIGIGLVESIAMRHRKIEFE